MEGRGGEVGAAPAQPHLALQLRGRCGGTPKGCGPGAPALEGLPRVPHRQLPGDGAAAGGPSDGAQARAGGCLGGGSALRERGLQGDLGPLPQGEPATWMTFLISYWGGQIGQKIRKITDW